jgi:pentatricopeptide repeat protein
VVAERTGTPQHSQVKLVWVSATSREAIITGFAQAAVAAFQNALTNREGHEHPDTIAARGLAHAYSSAGRPTEAVALYEQMADSADRQLGPGHPVTLTARAHLAEAYQAAARGKEALTAYQMLMTDSERLLGTRHPTTLGHAGAAGPTASATSAPITRCPRPHARTSRRPPGPEGRSG